MSRRVFTDALGREIPLEGPPSRIVSLVPSITDTLTNFGLLSRIAGITKFCPLPPGASPAPARVGGTKNPDLLAIARLMPDLVLANVEENRKEDVLVLAGRHPTYVTYPRTIEDLIAWLADLGEMLGVSGAARSAIDAIETGRARLSGGLRERRCVVYLIWRRPYMAAGGDTFIDAVLDACGLENLFHARPGRYFEVAPKEIGDSDPDFVLLSSEPYRFRERHRVELAFLAGLPVGRLVLLPGEPFCWFGPRTAEAFAVAERLHALLPG